MAAGVFLAHGKPVRRHLGDRAAGFSLGGCLQVALHRGSLAVQLDGAGKDTLHRQSGINATHHDFGHLVEKLPDVFLTLARDCHFIRKQKLRQRNLVVDEIFLQFSRMLEGVLGLPFVRWLVAFPLDESASD